MKETANMSIDLKKNRIRIHKTVLHSLGDPTYIQLLVNPAGMVVAVRRIDVPLSGEPVHKISEKRLRSDNSYEIYSLSFLQKLFELVPSIDAGGLYHLSGEVFPAKGMALFDLKTLNRVGP